jgi:amidohydrolase
VSTAEERSAPTSPPSWLDQWLSANGASVVAVRRQLHAHPELGHEEHQTTALLVQRLRAAGLDPKVLPSGTGLTCDIGTGERTVALRADIDALPVQDRKSVAYRSTVDGICHACGHDVHTAMLLATGLALTAAPSPGPSGRVRLIFQPAEELTSGGAIGVIEAGALADVDAIFALHCDPRLEYGLVGLRAGPITAAADMVQVRLTGPGGHTARPHLTADLVYALGRVIVDLPGLLSRAVDPRAGLSLVWGNVEAGRAPNAIPSAGMVRGTVRMLDRAAWEAAPDLIRRLVAGIAAPSGATAEVDYVRGVPPVDNDPGATALLRAGATAALGSDSVVDTLQSLGGEDFAWYLDHVPGALARLGVAKAGPPVDLHQGTFDVDERAIGAGVRVLLHTAYHALRV